MQIDKEFAAAAGALHRGIYECTCCQDELRRSVVRAQPPWDPDRAPKRRTRWLMLVGEAPGPEEALRARRAEQAMARGTATPSRPEGPDIAFRGQTGARLLRWLGEAGITPAAFGQEVLKTALTKCFPGYRRPGNQESGIRKPTKAEIKRCEPFLKRQIEVYRPPVILAMGVTAGRWFFPEATSIDALVGPRRNWSSEKLSAIVVCIPHASPANAWAKRADNQHRINEALGHLRELRGAWARLMDSDVTS